MTINQSNVVFIYNSEDPDGEYFAKRYKSIHNLSDEQLIGIDTDTEEIVNSYEDFKAQLEVPLRQKLIELKSGGRKVFAIVLGWRIPSGFYHNGKIISSTSRLSAIAPIEVEQPFDLNRRNPLYNRGVFKRYDEEDADIALIVTQIDAASRQHMDRKFDDFSTASTGIKTDGKFYFDLYSGYGDGERATKYQERLNLFNDTTINRVTIPNEKTVQIDEFNDVFFGQLRGDSIFWGWGFDIITSSYFYERSANRVFFYNADFNSLKSIRSYNVTYPGAMAIAGGYVAVAGAMDEITRTDEVVVIPSVTGPFEPYGAFDPYMDPYASEDLIGVSSEDLSTDSDPYLEGPYEPYAPLDLIDIFDPGDLETSEPSFDIFLDPIPFFDAVLRGAPLGEAYLFSNPFLNNSMTIYGDPLMPMIIPNIDKNLEKINLFDAFTSISEYFAKAYSYLTRRAAAAFGLTDRILKTCDVDYAANFIKPATNVSADMSYDKVFSKMTKLGQSCQSWITDASFNLLPPKDPTFVEYLYFSATRVSDVFLAGCGNQEKTKEVLPIRFLYEEGSWVFETTIQEMHPYLFFLVQFELVVSLDIEFTEIIFDIRSVENLAQWEYEEPFGNFINLTYEGVPSSLKGRRLRYRSDEFQKFTRFSKLFLKYRQVGDAFYYTPYNESIDIVSH
jgi:uncharacterized protein (TIGR03790 family)